MGGGGWKRIGKYKQWEITDNGEYKLNDDDRQWKIRPEEWQTMENDGQWVIPVKWWQIMGNDSPGWVKDNRELHTIGMTGNGELHTMEMTNNVGWMTIGNYRQWGLLSNSHLCFICCDHHDIWLANGKWQTIRDDRQWRLQTMENNRQWRFIYNRNHRPWGIKDNKQWEIKDNVEYQLHDDRQWEITDQGGIADNGELHIMEMTDNVGWKTSGNYRN